MNTNKYTKLYKEIAASEKNFFDIVLKLISFRQQLKISHWQTESYEEHVAFDRIYDSLDDLIDSFVEKIQGQYGRFKIDQSNSILLKNLGDLNIVNMTDDLINFLVSDLPSYINPTKDTHLLNIRDEIVGELNELKYLLTLK